MSGLNQRALGLWTWTTVLNITMSFSFLSGPPDQQALALLSRPHASPLSLISASRETLRSRKKSDYSLNKGSNAPILTNTTLNVIRLVGE